MEPMVQVRGLRKAYGSGQARREVLRGLDLDAGRGEMICVTGPSGSGKSTLLNIIGGLDTAYDGSVRVAGTALAGLGDAALSAFRRASVGFVFQHFNLLDHLTCLENVDLPACFSRGSARPARGRAADLLERVGMAEKAGSMPAVLSGGEKQRVAIARALMLNPGLLLCDEPTGDLDLTTAGAILDLFDSLRRDEGLTLIVVTHEGHVASRADRVARLLEGRLQ